MKPATRIPVPSRAVLCTAAVVSCLFALPSAAWGPVTQASIVTTAGHVVSGDIDMPLARFMQYIRDGAMISEDQQSDMFPAFAVDAVATIGDEMYLLQTVRADRVDPYFAYRLGILGKLVVQTVAPMTTANPAVRARYYSDVEEYIDGVTMTPGARDLVDPPAYFSRAVRLANENNQTILVDYRGGSGFDTYARSALPNDASRAVDAVADVWYTIFVSPATVVNVARTEVREYALGAIAFYLEDDKLGEAEDTYARLAANNDLTPDLQKQIGDLFFDAGHFERAMAEYEKVLEEQPRRRDVMERISAYYERIGDAALESGKLEEARDAFESAVDANKLEADIQRKLLESESMIFERDERLLQQQNALATARELEDRAETEAARGSFAQALAFLREAETHYDTVTEEFPAESRAASVGVKNLASLRQEYNQKLIQNAQSFSGKGYAFEARTLARTTPTNEDAILRDILRNEYRAAVQNLREQFEARLQSEL